MKNNYKVIYYYSKEDELYLAFAPELPGCCADGKSLQDALENLEIIVDEWIDAAKEMGRSIPAFSDGEFTTTNPTIFDVSKYILEKTGTISTMTLEKLNYYCLAWSLAWYNKAIFSNKFQAWKNGPVCRDLFDKHKHQRVISAECFDSAHVFSDEEKKIMDCVIAVYGSEDGEFLSALTHSEDPWKITRGDLSAGCNSEREIANELIRKSYSY